MRFRLPLGKSLFFVGALLALLIALLPLRLAADWLGLGERGFAAREARGSIWSGKLVDTRIAGLALGDLRTDLNVAPLLLMRARVDFKRPGNEDERGAISLAPNGLGIDDVTGRLPIGPLFAPLPISTLDLGDVSAHFRGSRCVFAEGRASTRLEGDVAGISLPGGLSGNARCDAGALLLPLVSQSGMERIALRFFEGNHYRADFLVRGGDAALRERLLAAGFTPGPAGYLLSVVGAL